METTVAKLTPDHLQSDRPQWQTLQHRSVRVSRVRPKKLLDTSWPGWIDAGKAGTWRGGTERKRRLDQSLSVEGGVIYVVTAFRAEAQVQGGNPILVKRPLEK